MDEVVEPNKLYVSKMVQDNEHNRAYLKENCGLTDPNHFRNMSESTT